MEINSPSQPPWVTLEENTFRLVDSSSVSNLEPPVLQGFKAFVEAAVQQSQNEILEDNPDSQLSIEPEQQIGIRVERDLLAERVTSLLRELEQSRDTVTSLTCELGYYQGVVAAKQEQLQQLSELRRKAALAIAWERKLAQASEHIQLLETELADLKSHPASRIVNGVLAGCNIHPVTQWLLLLLIITASSAMTVYFLTGG